MSYCHLSFGSVWWWNRITCSEQTVKWDHLELSDVELVTPEESKLSLLCSAFWGTQSKLSLLYADIMCTLLKSDLRMDLPRLHILLYPPLLPQYFVSFWEGFWASVIALAKLNVTVFLDSFLKVCSFGIVQLFKSKASLPEFCMLHTLSEKRTIFFSGTAKTVWIVPLWCCNFRPFCCNEVVIMPLLK